MKQKVIHLIPLACIVLIGGIISLILNASYIGSIFFFLIIPSIYLSFLAPKAIKKALLFSVAILGIPLIIDGLLIVNNAWFVETIFSSKLIGLIPLEDIVFSLFSIYFVVLVYEYLWESYKTRSTWPSRMHILALLSFLLVISFVLLFFLAPETLLIPYAYFWVLFVLGFIPSVIALCRYPKIAPKLFSMVAVCFPFAIFYEVVALKTKIWGFQGYEYIAVLSFFGFKLPFEEFFFFLLLFPVGVLAYYVLFDDNRTMNI